MDYLVTITSNEAGDEFTVAVQSHPHITATGANEAAALAAMVAKLTTLEGQGYFDYPKTATVTTP